jgi:hypothetical protein
MFLVHEDFPKSILRGNIHDVRARTIVRRTPKRTCDYPTIKSAPHQQQL